MVITGRTKYLIHQHPAVLGAAVVAMPHQRLGETVGAYVIPRAGAELTPESIIELLRSAGVARQKYPEKIIVVDEEGSVARRRQAAPARRSMVRRMLENFEVELEQHDMDGAIDGFYTLPAAGASVNRIR